MKKYRIYVGLNHQHTRKPVASTTMAKIILANILKTHGISGATMFSAVGVWEGITEPTTIIEIVDTESSIDTEKIKSICEEIKDTLNQNAVMVEKTEANVVFI